jgi:hypothetical protein
MQHDPSRLGKQRGKNCASGCMREQFEQTLGQEKERMTKTKNFSAARKLAPLSLLDPCPKYSGATQHWSQSNSLTMARPWFFLALVFAAWAASTATAARQPAETVSRPTLPRQPIRRIALQRAGQRSPSRFAYVALHYEGTPRDAEYLLGLRVLVSSIKCATICFVVCSHGCAVRRETGTPHDVVCLVSQNVCEVSRCLQAWRLLTLPLCCVVLFAGNQIAAKPRRLHRSSD